MNEILKDVVSQDKKHNGHISRRSKNKKLLKIQKFSSLKSSMKYTLEKKIQFFEYLILRSVSTCSLLLTANFSSV